MRGDSSGRSDRFKTDEENSVAGFPSRGVLWFCSGGGPIGLLLYILKNEAAYSRRHRRNMVDVGERRAELDYDALHVADTYDEEVRCLRKALTKLGNRCSLSSWRGGRFHDRLFISVGEANERT